VRDRQRRKQASQSARDVKHRPGQKPSTGTGEPPPQLPIGWEVFRGRALWICLALIAVTAMVYAPVSHFELVSWDDPQYVGDNPHIFGGLTWQGVSWAFTAVHAGYWLPMVWLSYMLDVQINGLDAGAFHVTNLLLHLVNTILLFGLLYRLTRALGGSTFVAGLFALHPLHVESVAWVTERKDVLSTLFWLGATWAYIGWVRRPSRARYGAVLVLFALGLMAKPMLVTLPLTLLLLDFWPLGRVTAGAGRDQRAAWLRLVREKLPLFAVSLASSVVAYMAQRSGGAVSDFIALPLSFRVTNALVSYVAYIGKMFWPVRLAAFYPLPQTLRAGPAAAAALILAVVSLLVLRAARGYPYLSVGWLWYLVTLMPVIGLLQVGQQSMADRFTYVPLIGLFLIIAWGTDDLLARWPGRRIPLAATAALVLAGCAAASQAQIQYWKNSTALWAHDLEAAGENAVAHNNLARVLYEQGKFDEAVTHYTRALQIAPENADAHNNLANAFLHRGRIEEAIAQYSLALRIQPRLAEAHNNMANALARLGKTDDAIGHYSEAIHIKPDYAEAHNGLGALQAGQGRDGDALVQYTEAVRIDPNYAEAHNNMAALLLGQGKTGEAIREFSEAARINPAKPEFHYNLGVVLNKAGQTNEAIDQFSTALKLKPDYQAARQALDSLGAGSGGRQ
jgi:protein O-mannosyl-transferase